MSRTSGWIGVDLDGTLAIYGGWKGPTHGGGKEDVITPIQAWCKKHIGQVLEITNVKDFGMIELWDDRCVQVEANTGMPVASSKDRKRKPYTTV